MANSLSFRIETDNTKEVLSELQDAVERALEICGGKAETYAKRNCPVDTGLLRNSITHAVGGKHISGTYHAEKGSSYTKKGNRRSAGSAKAGSVGFGSYSGSIGKEGDNTVYIGSNVEYAVYNELNHKTKSGFLRKAIENHLSEYKNVIQSELAKGN